MKTSSSRNSLDELAQNDPTCFLCLELINEIGEPLIDGRMLRKCGCVFHVHPSCWNKWLSSGKSEFDCPICRRASITITIPDEPPLTRVRTQSFPYADESYICCCDIPDKYIIYLILAGILMILIIVGIVILLKR